MLKNIPKIISPELVKYLMEMGHGDELVIADANFPAHRIGQRVVRCDGHGVPVILDAILQLLPLDTYSDYQAGLMQVVPGDPTIPVIWDIKPYLASIIQVHLSKSLNVLNFTIRQRKLI